MASGAFDLNYLRWLPEDKSAPVLDVGCGAGILLRWLESLGYPNAEGVDTAPSQVEACRQRGLRAHHVESSGPWLAERKKHYSCIFFRDILEHMPFYEAVELLRLAGESLREGGRVIARIPNAVGLAGLYLRYQSGDHFNSFTEYSLASALRQAGLGEINLMPKKTYYRSRWKGRAFELLRLAYYRLLALGFWIETPGSARPTIYTNTLVAVAGKEKGPA